MPEYGQVLLISQNLRIFNFLEESMGTHPFFSRSNKSAFYRMAAHDLTFLSSKKQIVAWKICFKLFCLFCSLTFRIIFLTPSAKTNTSLATLKGKHLQSEG